VNPASLWPDAAALSVAASAIYLSDKYLRSNATNKPAGFVKANKNLALNGLRGYVIFFIFLHHALVWHLYIREDIWQASTSYLHTHLGHNRVFILLMLSGYLFTGKILDSKNKPFHWRRFYISRILRLVPLYLFMIFAALLITMHATDYQLREPLFLLLKHIGVWLSFSFLGSPSINGVSQIAISGVAWTLPYEWFFYAILPLFALLLRVSVSWPYLIFAAASTIGLYYWNPNWILVSAFGFGGAAAMISRISGLPNLLNGKIAASLAIVLLLIVTFALPSGGNLASRTLLCLAFIIVASGNSIFGILNIRLAQSLGDHSYSIYLMHSIVLYIAFKFILGTETASSLSGTGHWLVVLACVAILIPLCYSTYRWIEQPSMRLLPKLNSWFDRQTTTGSGSNLMPKRS
jgi:peptidoglycan/LPS O-acetylase OafA/YrhL